MDKLKPEFVKKKPFIKLDKSVAKNADKAFECFEEYSEAVEDVVTDKLPDLLERVEKVIKEMNKEGILIDLAHTGYKTAMEVIEVSEKPVVFTHSNPRKMYENPGIKDLVSRSQ